MNLTHKIEILPNKKQQVIINKACGTARFTYNYALKQYQNIYNEHKLDNNKPKPNIFQIKKEFNRIKESEFPWMSVLSSYLTTSEFEQVKDGEDVFLTYDRLKEIYEKAGSKKGRKV